MMKRLMPILFIVLTFASACEKSESKLQAADREELQAMFKEIQELTSSATCTDPEEWSFTALGSKACGGPQMYIAYPHAIDTVAFLELVKRYTEAEKAYNQKHNIISDCMMVMPPNGIKCQDGEPVLVYDNTLKLN